MNPRTKQKLEKINNRLAAHGQQTRIVMLSADSLSLNTGKTFSKNDANKFIKRVMNQKISDWVENIDRILLGEVDEATIKSKAAAIGGRSCQAIHGEKIRGQLNTGIPWNKGTKGNAIGTLPRRTDETKRKIGQKNKGESNGRYGYRYTDEEREDKSRSMKESILNGDFTPRLNNRNTHWDSELDGVSYRSSWEALYKYFTPTAEYETLRIKYEYKQESKVYIVDFIDHVNKLVVEVKPKELCYGEKFQAKMKSLNQWAYEHGYSVLLIDRYWLLKQDGNIDYTRFNQLTATKIRKLYETSKTHRN